VQIDYTAVSGFALAAAVVISFYAYRYIKGSYKK